MAIISFVTSQATGEPALWIVRFWVSSNETIAEHGLLMSRFAQAESIIAGRRLAGVRTD